MQTKACLLLVYSLVLIVGGIIGMVKAGSLVSLLMSGGFALLLLICAYLIWKNVAYAYPASVIILTVLLLFFAQRFFTTYKTPPGAMMIVTAVTMWYLICRTPAKINA